MSHVTIKPLFGVFDQVRLIPACLADETSGVLKFRLSQVEVL